MTLRTNKPEWDVVQRDVRGVNFRDFGEGLELVAGGPPCQPFSIGGKHMAWNDQRDMFPEAVRAVREIRPQAFLFENVRGLTRNTFSTYLEYVILQLTYPSLVRRNSEHWMDHLQRLERHHTGTGGQRPEYKVVPPRVLNAANYGIPQKRERIFFVGFRSDINVEWSFPEPTHSSDSLAYQKWITGSYWADRHVEPTQSMPSNKTIAKLSKLADIDRLLPWVTLRDGIHGLPDPRTEEAIHIPNHVFQPGARPYPGHTGSVLDEPAKTLKAGDHGVPGGENMIAFPNGTYRYLSVRESARLQTFPDNYIIEGSWGEAMRQIGNAVPVNLAAQVASRIYDVLRARG